MTPPGGASCISSSTTIPASAAGRSSDGQDAGPYCIGNLANVPVELIEAENPLRIDEYGFLPDTGGQGRYRGALGMVRQYRLLADDVQVQVRSDRFTSRPWGLFGGGNGAGATSILNPGAADEQALPSKFTRRFKAGDVLRFEMAGAGGYGPAAERDPAAIEEDVRQGKVTVRPSEGAPASRAHLAMRSSSLYQATAAPRNQGRPE